MPVWILYLVALVEGYSTLAVQIIAMRLAIPVVGSSIVLTSIFMGIILLALSAGYWSGGILAARMNHQAITKTLGAALLFAGMRYVMISFGFEVVLLEKLLEHTGYIATLFLVSIILFFLPVFLASHTIPLLTELLPETSKGKSAGKMLFVSTIGSFLGSIVTSIVLFQTIGVYMSGLLVGVSVCLLAGVVYRYVDRKRAALAVVIAILQSVAYGLIRSPQVDGYSHDSAYQHIQIYDREYQDRPVRVFSLNDAYSSAIYTDTAGGTPFQYINEALNITKQLKPKNILVIGSAGFVYPELAALLPYVHDIDTIDIDPEVLTVAQDIFLDHDLHSKIDFFPYSGRYAINTFLKSQKSYDLIFLDAYNGKSLPDELVTREFFLGIDDLLSDEGVLIANMIIDSNMESTFAHKVSATLSSVRDELYIRNITNNPNFENDNFIVSTRAFDDYTPLRSPDVQIYTDDLSTAEVDVVEMLYVRSKN